MPQPLTIYFPANTVLTELADSASRSNVLELVKKTGAQRVAIEGYRGKHVVDSDLLREVRDAFNAAGLATLTGVMLVHNPAYGKRAEGVEVRLPCFCYSDEETVLALEAELVRLAQLFDEVVLDDMFMTPCQCATCASERRRQDWAGFRRDLLCGIAEQWVRAVHAAGPAKRLIVKFPQYYERYPRFGYDAPRFAGIFDAVWQGTETRDPTTLDYGYVEPYEGYFNAAWMRTVAGNKFESVWFDTLDCNEQHVYDQMVTSSLTAPANVTLFCHNLDLLVDGKISRLTGNEAALMRLRECATTMPRGVHVLLPPNADGGHDLYFFDYLGMLGIPCVPVTRLEPSMRSTIVTAHGANDPAVQDMIPRMLMAGRHVTVTWAALERFRENADLIEFFGYRPSGVNPGRTPVDSFELQGKQAAPAGPSHLAGDLEPVDASVLAWAAFQACERGVLRVPFVTAKSFASGGRAIVWNIGTFSQEAFQVREQLNVPAQTGLFNLPQPVTDLMRDMATAALGFSISCPARVAAFLFDRHVAFVNYTGQPATVEVTGLSWETDTLDSDSHRTACTPTSIYLAPHSHACLIRRTP